MAYKRKPSKYLELDGPVFDPAVQRQMNDAIADGLEELGDQASGILAGYVSAAGFVKTGAFLKSIDSKLTRTGDAAGYVKVAPTDVWPEKGRPTRTWLEKGTRAGVKLRPAKGVFAKTRSRMNEMTYDHLAAKLEAVLN